MVKSNLSVWGLYSFDNGLFDDLQLPTSLTKQTVVDNILLECAELQVLWSDPNFMKTAIGAWSRKMLPVWNEIERILAIHYDPQFNYNRYEEETGHITKTGTDTKTQTGTDTKATTGTDTLRRTGTDTKALTGTDTLKKTGTVETESNSTSVKDQDVTETKNEVINETEHEEKSEDQDTVNSVNGFNSNGSVADMAAHDAQALDKTTERDSTLDSTDDVTHNKSDDTTVTDDATSTTTNDLTDQTTKNLQEQETRDMVDTDTKNLQEQQTKNLTDQQTKNLRDDNARELHAWGNIGTISSQKLLMDELELRKTNLYEIITGDFKKQFCLCVYY